MSNQACPICSSQHCNCHNLEEGQQLRYEYDSAGNLKRVVKERKQDCWVVTAYYGDPFDPHVCAIRNLRDQLLAASFIGPLVAQVNVQYHRLGVSPIGSWWAAKLSAREQNIHKAVTKRVCALLLFCSHKFSTNY